MQKKLVKKVTNNDLAEKLDSLAVCISSIDTRVGSLEICMTSIETHVGSIETRVGSIETRIGSIENRIGCLETRMDSIEKRMDRFEFRMDGFDDKIISLTETVDKLAQITLKGFERHELILNTLTRRVDAIEGDIRDIKVTLKPLVYMVGQHEMLLAGRS